MVEMRSLKKRPFFDYRSAQLPHLLLGKFHSRVEENSVMTAERNTLWWIKSTARTLYVIALYPFLFLWIVISIALDIYYRPELHKLVDARNTGAIQAYIEQGKDLDVCDRAMQRTALHQSALLGLTQISQLLIEAGASTQIKDKEGATPLYIAALGGHTSIVELLSPFTDSTDLLAAIFTDNVAFVEQNIAQGGDPNSTFGGIGSALYIASKHGYLEIVRLLLKAGANPNRYARGQSPLKVAMQKGHTEIVELIVSSGAKITKPPNT